MLDTFGVVPRFYEFCKSAIRELKISRSGTKDKAAEIYNKTLGCVQHTYNLMNWVQWFILSPRDEADEQEIAEEHIKVLHTVAVAGVPVDPTYNVIPNSAIWKTYQQLSEVGMFTLRKDENENVRVFIPLITLDAFKAATQICPSDTLGPAIYSWRSMERIAMASLRCA